MSLILARSVRSLVRLAPLGAALALSGCYVDTSSMNTDEFVRQTRPIFYADAPAAAPQETTGYAAPLSVMPREPVRPSGHIVTGRTPLSTNYPVAPRPILKVGMSAAPGAAAAGPVF